MLCYVLERLQAEICDAFCVFLRFEKCSKIRLCGKFVSHCCSPDSPIWPRSNHDWCQKWPIITASSI